MKFLEKIFSIKNKDCHKIVTICGLKIKFKNKFKVLEHKISVLEKENIGVKKFCIELQKEKEQTEKKYIILQEKSKSLAEKNSELQRELESIQESLETVNYKQDSLKSQIVTVDKKYDTKTTAFIQKLRENNYEQLLADYKYNGFSQELLIEFKNLERSKFCWLVENNNLWLLYLLVLLENNILDDVDTIIKKYLHFHQLKDVENFPIVANYFHDLGYTNERIEKSSKIYKKITEAQQNKTFENLIKGKTIAVVGNGPSEIGKGKGAEIDSHDIVVRFNEFHIQGFESDYGAKTDIWVNYSANPAYKNFNKDFKVELNLWCFDTLYFRDSIGVDNLYSNIDSPIDIFGISASKEVWNEYNFYYAPTTGLYFIITLLKLRKSFTDIDFYGFSFLNTNDNDDLHYYKDDKKVNLLKYHNISEETIFLKKLFKDLNNEK